ncbi:MAG: hypothetical protein JW953_01820 [Anaerolineae bacterium]|nr:hypothetical protein [Anaerolineae bacterium]
MSPTILRILIAGVLAFHGVGHAMGIIPALQLPFFEGQTGAWAKNWSSRSWLLTPLLGEATSRFLSIILFAVPLIGFIAAALGLMGWLVPYEWWRLLAIVSAVISLVALALFWKAFIYLFPHKVGAIAVNVAVLVCLFWANWPSEADIGY